MLGLVATSLYNIAQISSAHQQIETTEWRDLLSSLDHPNANIAQSITLPFRLRSFSNSERYSQEARLIGAAVLSKVVDVDGFKQLFQFIFADQPENLEAMTDIQRQLNASYLKNSNACEAESKRFKFPQIEDWQNVCWGGYTDKQIQDFGVKVEDSDIWAMRKVFSQQIKELLFMSSRLASALRKASVDSGPGKNLKLTNVYIIGADLSQMDFTHFDISESTFDEVVLTGATLRPVKFDGSSLTASNWWDAAIIDKPFLQKLIDSDFPAKNVYFSPTLSRPTRLEYLNDVLALCHKVDLTCTEAHIPYEEDATGLSN